MADINAKGKLALGLYKPREYGLGTELQVMTEF